LVIVKAGGKFHRPILMSSFSKLGEKSASPRNGTVYHPAFVEYLRTLLLITFLMSNLVGVNGATGAMI
jgi:hypothetical protein